MTLHLLNSKDEACDVKGLFSRTQLVKEELWYTCGLTNTCSMNSCLLLWIPSPPFMSWVRHYKALGTHPPDHYGEGWNGSGRGGCRRKKQKDREVILKAGFDQGT